MSVSLVATTICLISSHPGPAEHFAHFVPVLQEAGYKVEVYASGAALAKLSQVGGVRPFEREAGAAPLVERCQGAAAVITDVGDLFALEVQQGLKERFPEIRRIAYYDNPEAWVAGGYSETAAKVMIASDRVFYANRWLAHIPSQTGIGFYPVEKAEEIQKKRAGEKEALRAKIFTHYGIEDKGQKIVVYIGGANDEYFLSAFPTFLSCLAEIDPAPESLFLLQQHPRAREKNSDRIQLEEWVKERGAKGPRFFVSELSTDEAVTASDQIAYHQTSMAPLLVLAGIPIIQVGGDSAPDLLSFCQTSDRANSARELAAALSHPTEPSLAKESVEQGVGYTPEWPTRLKEAMREVLEPPS